MVRKESDGYKVGETVGKDWHEFETKQNPDNSTYIKFSNHYGTQVDVYWINYQGEEVFYKSLYDGESYEQQTYIGHEWIVRENPIGKILDHSVGQQLPQECKISYTSVQSLRSKYEVSPEDYDEYYADLTDGDHEDYDPLEGYEHIYDHPEVYSDQVDIDYEYDN